MWRRNFLYSPAEGPPTAEGSVSDPLTIPSQASPQSNQQQDTGQRQDAPRPVTREEVTAIVVDNVKRGVKSVMADQMKVVQDSIHEIIQQAVSSNATGTDKMETPQAKEQSPPSKAQDTKAQTHETPMDTQLRRLEARLDSIEREKASLEDMLSAREKEMKVKDRDQMLLKVASEAGARNPNQVLKLVADEVVEDAEKGFVFEVDGEYGKEFRSPEEYIPDWLESNPHFRKTQSSGSGSGGGSSASGGGQRFTQEQISDPAFYSENKTAIHEYLEKQAGRR